MYISVPRVQPVQEEVRIGGQIPGTGATGGGELLDVGGEMEPTSSARSASATAKPSS